MILTTTSTLEGNKFLKYAGLVTASGSAVMIEE